MRWAGVRKIMRSNSVEIEDLGTRPKIVAKEEDIHFINKYYNIHIIVQKLIIFFKIHVY